MVAPSGGGFAANPNYQNYSQHKKDRLAKEHAKAEIRQVKGDNAFTAGKFGKWAAVSVGTAGILGGLGLALGYGGQKVFGDG